MTKTPEQMAADYVHAWWGPKEINMTLATRQSFIAGYQVAKEHAHAALEEAESRIDELQSKLSDAEILTTEHLLGADNSLEKPDGWISVKDRLPENMQTVIYRLSVPTVKGPTWKIDYGEWDANEQRFFGEFFDYRDLQWDVTHWMPLPAAPKEAP
jgi:hypothetical protein